ncbi:DUF3817 domain-containing protein [Mycobacterium sp. PSTR-4-N]|uniref:DUF3817 domain-containing protein n=1 Tax=Mycobacterium sp. PSTR-4-N TaxID=2917745 RepID=UPI001F155DAC|nr:DUF3817 domain-containing protein [Mycobacterium sp. PSTR-4-N]MCG7597873.1 DUF3817 domain-containing protein [Mycobacterium sp. PSTR-4-N]
MTRAFDVRSAAAWFRLIAFAEALSWIGLLAGMYFKYLGTPRTEVGVKIFGPIHGGVFIAFVAAAVLTGLALRWRPGTWLLALLGSIVPLGSVIFLIWADRTGRMGHVAGSRSVAVGGGQAGRTAPETT